MFNAIKLPKPIGYWILEDAYIDGEYTSRTFLTIHKNKPNIFRRIMMKLLLDIRWEDAKV